MIVELRTKWVMTCAVIDGGARITRLNPVTTAASTRSAGRRVGMP